MKEEIKGSVEGVKFPDKESFQKLKLNFKKMIYSKVIIETLDF